jgi:putative addiction module killer protein
MFEIERTLQFDKWLLSLRDRQARLRILSRVQRLASGNFGDVKPVGEGVSELRIHYAGGYRVYFKQTDKTIIIVLCGGDKSTQSKDINLAKSLLKELQHDT